MHACTEVRGNRAHHVLERWQLGPGFRSAPHMIQNEAGIKLRRDLCYERIEGKGTGLVDDLDAVLQRLFRDCALIGVHREGNGNLPAQPLEYRNEPAEFLSL